MSKREKTNDGVELDSRLLVKTKEEDNGDVERGSLKFGCQDEGRRRWCQRCSSLLVKTREDNDGVDGDSKLIVKTSEGDEGRQGWCREWLAQVWVAW